MGQTRGDPVTGIVAIACSYKDYEVILIAIWGTAVISNFQFKTKGGN